MTLTKEIEEIVLQLTPKCSVGLLTMSDIKWYIKTAADKAALAGYAHATDFTEERMKKMLESNLAEIDGLKDTVANLQKEVTFLMRQTMIDDYEIHDLRMQVAFDREYQYKLNRLPNCRDPDHE